MSKQVWVQPPNCPRCGKQLEPVSRERHGEWADHGEWACLCHKNDGKCLWWDWELTMILRCRLEQAEAGMYNPRVEKLVQSTAGDPSQPPHPFEQIKRILEEEANVLALSVDSGKYEGLPRRAQIAVLREIERLRWLAGHSKACMGQAPAAVDPRDKFRLANAVTEALREMASHPEDSVQDIFNEKLREWKTGMRIGTNMTMEEAV